MALGNNNYGSHNSNKEKGNYSPNVYSAYKFNNGESLVDQTSLSFSYWNNMLKVSIAPRKQTNNDEMQFDYDNAISMYLNHTKARILHDELVLFLADPDAYTNLGIPSGQGIITISNNEFGKCCPCIAIRKLDGEGTVQSSFAYQFKTDYHYSIRNYSPDSASDFETITDDYANLEIQQVITLLESYYGAMTNAIAYTMIEQGKYNESRINTKLELMAAKLGVQFGKPGGERSKPAESIFNKKQQSNKFSSTTIDDIGSILD